jgi:YVTN family beta-propeller protein
MHDREVFCRYRWSALRCALILAVGWLGLASPAVAWATWRLPCENRVYVSNSYNNTVSVIDTVTNEVIATIPVGLAPINPTIAPDGRRVYVSNSQGGTISVIDVKTNKVVDELHPDGEEPSGLAFTPLGRTLVVSLLGDAVSDAGWIQQIDLKTGKKSKLIAVGAQPERLALSPLGNRAYVVGIGDSSLSVVDLWGGKVIERIQLGSLAFNILVSPLGHKVYVGVIGANEIAVIDAHTNTLETPIQIASPAGLSFSRDYLSIFTTNIYANTISQVSRFSGQVIKSAPAGALPSFIRLTRDGRRAYVARPYGSDVAVFDTETLAEIDSIATGSPTSLAVCGSP